MPWRGLGWGRRDHRALSPGLGRGLREEASAGRSLNPGRLGRSPAPSCSALTGRLTPLSQRGPAYSPLPCSQATWSTPTARPRTAARRCPARWPWSMTTSSNPGGSECWPLAAAQGASPPPRSPPWRSAPLDALPASLQVVLPRGRRQLRERQGFAAAAGQLPAHAGRVHRQAQPGQAYPGHGEGQREQDGECAALVRRSPVGGDQRAPQGLGLISLPSRSALSTSGLPLAGLAFASAVGWP